MHKNDKFIFQFKLIIHIYLIFLLFPLFFTENTQRKLDNEQIITAIFTGNGELSTVSSSSTIKPKTAYLTSPPSEIGFGNSQDYTIFINNDKNENNITLVFKNNDFYLSNLFKGLKYIKKVDLSLFKSKPKDTSYMFYNCNNLEEIIFGNFDTSNVGSMSGMFQNIKVTSLDLSRFKTDKVSDMKNMFKGCGNLNYLNLKNFKFSGIKDDDNIEQMLSGCKDSLKYLNVYSLEDKDEFDYDFFEYAKNLIYCINETIAPAISKNLKKKGFILNCSYFSLGYNLNDEQTESKDEIIIKLITQTDIKSSINSSSKDFFNEKYEYLNTNTTSTVEDKDNIITNLMDDIINGNLNSLLDDIIDGEKDDLIISQEDISFQVTTTEKQNNNEYNNISTIHLGNCETILKNIYGIPPGSSLIILKVDYFMEEFKFPVIGYEVFDPVNKTKLNLSYCDNETVNYNIPIDISEEDLEKYNASSDYYNDECSVYTTEDGTDIIILDRKKEFNDNNFYLCENDCNYTDYNSSSKKSVCMCDVKSKIYSISELINNKESLSQSFNVNDSSTSSSNLGLMKCIDTLFSKYGLLKNLENYILIIMTFLYAGSSIVYYRLGSSLLESDITEILENKFENEKKNKEHGFKRRKSIKSIKMKEENDVSNPKKKKRKSSLHKSDLNKENKMRKSITINKKEFDINADYNKSLSIFKLKHNSTNNMSNVMNDTLINSNINDYELNTLPYKEALLYDKRDILGIYFSILRKNHPLLFSFIPN